MNERKSSRPTRAEVTDKGQRCTKEYERINAELTEDADDVETLQEILEQMDLGGTADATEIIERGIDAAGGAAQREFDEDFDALEAAHGEGREYEAELHEQSENVERDLSGLSDGKDRLHGDTVKTEVEKAREEEQRDIEFLDGQEREAKAKRDASGQSREHDRQRVQRGKGA